MQLNSAVVWAAVCCGEVPLCCVGSGHADIVLLPSGNRPRHQCTQVRNSQTIGKIPVHQVQLIFVCGFAK